MKIILGYEWKYTEKHWLHQLLEKQGWEVVVVDSRNVDRRKKLKKWHKIFELCDYFVIANKARKIAKQGDIFISWCCTTGVIFSALFKRQKCKVLALHLLTQKNDSFTGKLRNILYFRALNNPFFHTACSTNAGIEIAIDIFGEKYREKFCLLNDAFISEKIEIVKKSRDYCFSGGASGRDWVTLCRVCQMCPEIQFLIVAGSGTFDNRIQFPPNVEIYFDIAKSDFDEKLRGAKMVALPLISEMTSGLIVLFEAIRNQIITVSSNIEAVEHYYPERYRELLCPIGDAERMAMVIKKYYMLDNTKIALDILQYNEDNNSISEYGNALSRILESL